MHWHLITGEYPPAPGGVGDYTRAVACELVGRGEEVDVWAPENGCADCDAGVRVHRLPGRFGRRARRCLQTELAKMPRPRVLLVQYVPHMYGCRAMNVPFCRWLRWLGSRETIWTMFHEVQFAISRRQSLKHNILGVVTRFMAKEMVRASVRVFVSSLWWRDLLIDNGLQVSCEWLPVPSNLPTVEESEKIEPIRRMVCNHRPALIVGHFGTYAPTVTGTLKPALSAILKKHPDVFGLLIGRGSLEFKQQLCDSDSRVNNRLFATGSVESQQASNYIASCDVLVQPYADGISTRRTSTMAGLALGAAIVTTTGNSTESIWTESGGVEIAADPASIPQHVDKLLADANARAELQQRAKSFYEDHFAVKHTVDALLANVGQSQSANFETPTVQP